MIKTIPLHGSVTEDYVHYIANNFTEYNGTPTNFKNKDGSPKLDLILYMLGFHWNDKANQAVYELLTEDVRSQRRRDSTEVYVRNDKLPYEVKRMRVYIGNIREDYPYKDLYHTGNILIGDFSHGSETYNILDVGDPNCADYVGVEYRVMREVGFEVEE